MQRIYLLKTISIEKLPFGTKGCQKNALLLQEIGHKPWADISNESIRNSWHHIQTVYFPMCRQKVNINN